VGEDVFSYNQGPLPDPETFHGYGEVVEDAPERMLSMVEREQRHRYRMEISGQLVGALAILGGLVGGFILIWWGYGIASLSRFFLAFGEDVRQSGSREDPVDDRGCSRQTPAPYCPLPRC
jgi:hypothetical protein